MTMVGMTPRPYVTLLWSKPSWLEMVWEGAEYGDPTVDDEALGIDGAEPEEISAGGIS